MLAAKLGVLEKCCFVSPTGESVHVLGPRVGPRPPEGLPGGVSPRELEGRGINLSRAPRGLFLKTGGKLFYEGFSGL